MKIWQKNYLYSFGLFLIALYLCIFLITNNSFSATLAAERSAAAEGQALLAQALASDIGTLHARGEYGEAAESAVAKSYVRYYYKRGVSVSVWRSGVLLGGSGEAPDTTKRMVQTMRTDGKTYVCVYGALPQLDGYSLSYARDISARVEEQQRLAFLLSGVGFGMAVALMTGLYITLRHIYTPMDTLAHELRTSLTAIRGYGEYLQLAMVSEEEHYAATDFIVKESERLTDIAEKLLILGNLREGSISFAAVEVQGLFLSAAQAFPKVRYEETAGEIHGDVALLQSLINNLVKNAVEAEAKHITLRFADHSITILDDGRGMDEATLALAAHPPKRGEMKGEKGMGLALCHRIAALHGASLHFSSQVEAGRGTEVRLTFPESP